MGNSCTSEAQEPFESYQPPSVSNRPLRTSTTPSKEPPRLPKKVSLNRQHSDTPQRIQTTPTASSMQNEAEFMKYILDFQQKTYERLEHDFQQNRSLFILNQLLLSFQFFDNFDRCKAEAEKVKIQKEEAITQKLAELAFDGPLGGNKSVILVNAMGEILSRFYVYKPKNGAESTIQGKEENSDVNTKSSEPSTSKSQQNQTASTTFMHNSILPLDFFVSLDEFEPQLDTVITSPSMPLGPGDPSKIKCYMEERHRTNKTPKGFVRLRVSGPGTSVTTSQDDTDTYYSGGGTGTYENTSERLNSILSEEDDELADSFNDIESRLTDAESYGLPIRTSNGFQADAVSDNFYFGTPNGIIPRSRSNAKPKTATINPTPEIIPNKNYVQRSRSRVSDATFSPPAHLKAQHTATDLHLHKLERNKFELKKLSDYKQIALPSSEHRVHPYILVQVETIRHQNDDSLHNGVDEQSLEIQELVDNDVKEQEEEEQRKKAKLAKDGNAELDNRRPSSTTMPKIQRTYLNSTTISDIFVGEFNTWGDLFGIPRHDLSQAEVFAATIRSCVTTRMGEEAFRQLYTITPVIHHKNWPQQARAKFIRTMLKDKQYFSGSNEHGPYSIHWKHFAWLTDKQVHNLLSRGCDLVPRGYRGMFFNTLQSLEWQVEFPLAENLLLDTLKRVHWRLYITMAILFRSYISTLGPKGITLEHIRHLLYAKCFDDFFRWYDEEPGKQLIQLMDAFYSSLADRQLDNFFLPKCNMLRSTSFHDAVLVQYNLRMVQEDILKYTIKSFRDLHWLKTPGENFWPKLDLSKLYKLITLDDDGCFEYILHLRMDIPTKEFLRLTSSASEAKTKDKKRKSDRKFRGISTIAMNTDGPTVPTDVYMRWRAEQHKKHEQQKRRERKQTSESAENSPQVPESSEKRQSIDLNQDLVKDYKEARVSAIVDMFIQHFLGMAETALEFESYSEATMYALHVLNMCKLAELNREAAILIQTDGRESYEAQAHEILEKLGPNKEDYIRSKLRDAGTEDTAVFFRGFLSQRNEVVTLPQKELETPKPVRQPSILKLERSRIAESVKFLPQPSTKRLEPISRIQEEPLSDPEEEQEPEFNPPPPPPIVPPKPKRTPSTLSENTRPAPRKVRETVVVPPPKDYDSTDSDNNVRPSHIIKLLNINHGNFMKRTPSFFAEKAAQKPVSSNGLY